MVMSAIIGGTKVFLMFSLSLKFGISSTTAQGLSWKVFQPRRLHSLNSYRQDFTPKEKKLVWALWFCGSLSVEIPVPKLLVELDSHHYLLSYDVLSPLAPVINEPQGVLRRACPV